MLVVIMKLHKNFSPITKKSNFLDSIGFIKPYISYLDKIIKILAMVSSIPPKSLMFFANVKW